MVTDSRAVGGFEVELRSICFSRFFRAIIYLYPRCRCYKVILNYD